MLSTTEVTIAFLPDELPTIPCVNSMSVSDWSVFQSPLVSLNSPQIPPLWPSEIYCLIAVWSGLIVSISMKDGSATKLPPPSLSLSTTLPVIVAISPLAVLNTFCDTVSPIVNTLEPAGDILVVLKFNLNLSSERNLSVTATPSPDSKITFCSSA